jgi:exosortase A
MLFFVALSLFNYPVLETLWRHSFDDGTYSHAFLIPFIVIYLFFELGRSGKLIFRTKISILSIALLTMSGLFLFLTSNAQISLGYWLAILILATSGLITLFNFSWIIVFPVAFFIFIFPFWGLLIPFLQNLSITAVTFIMGFTGIPTYVEAEFINIPAGIFEIAGGCSGLRYFIVSIAISSLFIFLYIKNLKRAALFFGVAILGALITNWIRITALIVIGEYTNMESSLMEDHNTFGWYIYIPFMMLLFKWGNTLIDTDIFQNSGDAKPNNKPKISALLLVLIVLLISSTTIKSYFNRTEVPQNISAIQPVEPSPKVHFYSNMEQKSVGIPGDSYKIFNFNGSNLDGKPSYYENELLPKGYIVIHSEIKNDWNVYFAKSNKKNAVILFRYELDDVTYTSMSTFKVARLKKAFININNTKLHWVYLTCESDCELTLNNFFNMKINTN